MDILDNMPIIVGAETINNAYLKLLSEFTSEDSIYESRSAIISILALTVIRVNGVNRNRIVNSSIDIIEYLSKILFWNKNGIYKIMSGACHMHVA